MAASEARRIAGAFGLVLRQMAQAEPGRIVLDEASGKMIGKPWLVEKDGEVLARFPYAFNRLDWLRDYAAQRREALRRAAAPPAPAVRRKPPKAPAAPAKPRRRKSR